MTAIPNVSFSSSNSGTQVGLNTGTINIQSQTADLLDKLPIARGAELDSYTDQHEDECLDGTRTELLQRIREWALSPFGKCIFWLNGMAGTGKSTICRTVARSFQREQLATVTFFFKRGEGDRGNATRFFPTISQQLATRIPGLATSLRDAFSIDPDVGEKSLKIQFQQLLLQPLIDLHQAISHIEGIVMVIDALDECETDKDIGVILHLLPQLQEISILRVRIFLTSRPELPIRLGFSKMTNHQYQDLALHEIPEEVTSHDISLFLRDRFQKIQDEKNVPTGWPGEEVIRATVVMSVPLFISAATVCRHVESKLDPVEGLADLIKDQAKYSTKMDKTYLPVLMRLLSGQEKDETNIRLQYFQRIVGSIVLLADPFSANALSRFLGLQEIIVLNLLDSFRSVIRVPNSEDEPVQIFHQSFRDFVLQTSSRFYIDQSQTHKDIVLHCLRTMRAELKRDICNLRDFGMKRIDINEGLIKRHLQPELQYSCRYWVRHLEQLEHYAEISDIIQDVLAFLRKHFLHWVEAMSTLGLASEVAMALNTLQKIALNDCTTDILDFLHDSKRFILKCQQIVNDVPLQVYCAGLAFAPERSIIRRNFIEELHPWIYQLPSVNENWSVELQTLESLSPVTSVAFSPDGRLLASCSGRQWDDDSDVQLWDSATGALRHTLKGHSKPVTSLVFSPNGCLLASGSKKDGTVRFWDSTTGTLWQTLEETIVRDSALAFSPNGCLLASGSKDGTIRLWDSSTGTLRQTFGGNSDPVRSVAFSPEGKLLASGVYIFEVNQIVVRIWDTATGTIHQTLEDHSDDISPVVFSPDGEVVAFGAGKFYFQYSHYTVRLWDMSTGTLQELEGHSKPINSVVFSPDSRLLASGSEDMTLRLWDSATGALRYTLKGHSASVTSLIFSPDGRLVVSSCAHRTFANDYDIRLWDPATGALLQILRGHSAGIHSIAFSPDSRLLASGSEDMTVRLWDPTVNQQKQTLSGHQEEVNSLALSPDGNFLASSSSDKTLSLWDAVTGTLKRVLEGHHDAEGIRGIAFPPDSRLLASTHFGADGTKTRLWESTTGVLQQIVTGSLHWVEEAFSLDGCLLALKIL